MRLIEHAGLLTSLVRSGVMRPTHGPKLIAAAKFVPCVPHRINLAQATGVGAIPVV
jgi:hypothetical protein